MSTGRAFLENAVALVVVFAILIWVLAPIAFVGAALWYWAAKLVGVVG